MYYRNAQAALVVYDLTKPTSLTKAKHWVAELQRQASPGIVIALVGNKLDLANESSASSASGSAEEDNSVPSSTADDEDTAADDAEDDTGAAPSAIGDPTSARKISTREAKSYAEEESLLFFETSAKTGTNVAEVFTAIANSIPETSLKGPRGATTGVGGATQAAISGAANRADEARVNLNERLGGNRGKGGDNCAC